MPTAGLHRTQLTLDQPAGCDQPAQALGHDGSAQPESGSDLGGSERPVRPGIAGEQVTDRVGHRFRERFRDSDGQRGAERVLETAGVLDRRPSLDPRDPHPDDAPRRLERLEPAERGVDGRGLVVVRAHLDPGCDLGCVERSQEAQQVGDALRAAQSPLGRQSLQFRLRSGERRGVEQVAQRRTLAAAEEFREQAGVQGERGGPALGQRRVPLVQELRDVAEQQAPREGRRLRGLDLDQADGARLHLAHQRDEPGDVEDVLQALADGLEHDREAAVLARHLQQLRRALPLLPQRLALAGSAPGQQQGPRRALAEPGREQCRATELGRHEVFDVVRVEEYEVGDVGRAAVVGLDVRQA